MNTKTTIGLADDHKLLRNALANLINSFGDFEVVLEANNGLEVIALMEKARPDIMILDFNMPELNGHKTAELINEKYPEVKTVMLTMYDTELMLVKMLQAGVRGFMKKDIHPIELHNALKSIKTEGYYYSTYTSNKLACLFRDSTTTPIWDKILNEAEQELMKLVCTELTYKEIATKMNISPRSIDTLRDGLFEKLEVRSRVGLAMYAIKHGLVLI